MPSSLAAWSKRRNRPFNISTTLAADMVLDSTVNPTRSPQNSDVGEAIRNLVFALFQTGGNLSRQDIEQQGFIFTILLFDQLCLLANTSGHGVERVGEDSELV